MPRNGLPNRNRNSASPALGAPWVHLGDMENRHPNCVSSRRFQMAVHGPVLPGPAELSSQGLNWSHCAACQGPGLSPGVSRDPANTVLLLSAQSRTGEPHAKAYKQRGRLGTVGGPLILRQLDLRTPRPLGRSLRLLHCGEAQRPAQPRLPTAARSSGRQCPRSLAGPGSARASLGTRSSSARVLKRSLPFPPRGDSGNGSGRRSC